MRLLPQLSRTSQLSLQDASLQLLLGSLGAGAGGPAPRLLNGKPFIDSYSYGGARSATLRQERLEANPRRRVLPEQAPVPDIPPHHRRRPVPGLVHNRPLRSTADRRGRGQP